MLVQAVITEISNTDVISACLRKDPSTTCSANSNSTRITCPAATHNWNNGPAVVQSAFVKHYSLWLYRWRHLVTGWGGGTGSTKSQPELNLL